MIHFGKKVRDTITGFEGIATGHCRYISGCNQTLITPALKPDGDFREARWFDDQRVVELDGDAITLDNAETPGADVPAPVR